MKVSTGVVVPMTMGLRERFSSRTQPRAFKGEARGAVVAEDVEFDHAG
jgi:hypothetical protein